MIDLLQLFLTHLQGYKRQAVWSPILIVVEVICELLLPLVMAEIVDTAIPAGDETYIFQLGAVMLVLAGVALSSLFSGGSTLLQYFADEQKLGAVVFWTFGDLGSTSWQSLRGMALAVLLLIIYCYLHRWDYNALLSGEETALSLGINVQRLTLTNVVLTCLVCSIIVSNVGLINFIGLVAPHIVRMVVGNNYIYLIPGSVLAGAALLLLSDLVARVVIMPVILPIGALTAFLGGPLFLYLLFKGRGRT